VNNSDMPAMPYTEYDKDGNLPTGLTKREYFAGLAMQGLLASGKLHVCDTLSEQAWDAADNLLYVQRLQAEQEQAK